MAISVALLTPMLLASSPAQVTLPDIKYDHTTQVQVGKSEAAAMPTFSGTQTFMPNGKPFDSDND
ncbi:MAG: hypothetical protein GC201_09705 [Alphaproteobacteria bacterium]|nr:hypothetical protein [Alphaproteobacteria bacterium]